MTESQLPHGLARPGGRTAATRAAVLAALRELLMADGHAGLTWSELARRSGVHRTTIYRRWGSWERLLADLFAKAEAELEPPRGETLEVGLIHAAGDLARHLDRDTARLAAALLAWPGPAARRVLDGFRERRRAAMAEFLRKCGADADAGAVVAALAGPLYFVALFERRVPDEDDIRRAVAGALAAADGRVLAKNRPSSF